MLYELRLNAEGIPETQKSEILVLPVPRNPYTLRIVISGTSSVVNDAILRCNYPPESTKFDRNTYYDHKLSANSIELDCYVDLTIFQSGAFSAYISYTDVDGVYSEEKTHQAKTKEWSFLVDSGINIKKNDEILTSDALCVQTVLSKLMGGPATGWDKKLAAISAKGYNMVHFVPLQPRGESDSPFSIEDQLGWDATTFPNGEQDVGLLVKNMTEKYGLLALSDIVLNHTANSSHWLEDHPEVGYSLKTSPHLEAALALDDGLLELSKKLGDQGRTLKDESDLSEVMTVVKDFIDKELKLWEFYVVESGSIEDSPIQNTDAKALQEVAASLIPQSTLSHRYSRRISEEKLQQTCDLSGFTGKQIVDAVNAQLYAEYNKDLSTIIDQIRGRLRYLRFELNPGQIKISADSPLIESYFTRLKNGEALANNGWVWGANPLNDFANKDSKAYLLRQVVIWDDCVKLRYGNSPDDCPFLWDRMSQYAQMLAKHFHGLRLDNCHSTPLHVGQFILDSARRIRPDLYVVAELFSGSEEIDKLYIEGLGINSLLREAMQSHSVSQLSSLIHSNLGSPIGSFKKVGSISGSPVHAWLMEVTHDNEMPATKFTVEDTLPIAGVVAMCNVTSGSTMGADECYGESLNVVSESREYTFGSGISEVKQTLNQLHISMAMTGMSESYLDQNGSFIRIHRVNPDTGEGIYMISRFKWDGTNDALTPIRLEKTRSKQTHGWTLEVVGTAGSDKDRILPVPTEVRSISGVEIKFEDGDSILTIDQNFPPGSVVILETTRTFNTSKLEELVSKAPDLSNIDLLDANTLLFRADGEERAASNGQRGTYNIPNYGNLVFAGLQGWEKVLSEVVRDQNMGHPICDNLRNGLWALEYSITRLENQKSFTPVVNWLKEVLELVRETPTFLRPRYFASCILTLYNAAVDRTLQLLNVPKDTNTFFKQLNLTSVQLVASVPGVSLYPNKAAATLAAGLPHFSQDIMRTWGRDTFLSLRGLLLITGRLEEARDHILGFGATLKYGLIPNLLDSGNNPRYNARDAAWFFVQSVQDYCLRSGDHKILFDKVYRRFPIDDSWTAEPTDHQSTVGELIFEILSRHAAGIDFREHNAGPAIDEHMKDNGFNQHIYVNWQNGFIYGGNPDNCGTWQDKMGESKLAGNDGVPGTPRDGAAVEIIGLLKSCLRWVREVTAAKHFDFPTEVKNQDGKVVKLEDWENLIQKSFEKCYYVPQEREDGEFDTDFSIVNRRGIYKDLHGSSKAYEDYQFRPNFCIAVVVAPELFTVNRVTHALKMCDEILQGPVGMATLDPSDWNYRPYYINSVDSSDFATSRGRNYHQGPEWVWLKGVYLQAIVKVNAQSGKSRWITRSLLRDRLASMVRWLEHSPWAGLTELTQENGEICPDSSPSQAWSSAHLLEAINELNEMHSTSS